MPSACANTRTSWDHIRTTHVAGDFPERVAAANLVITLCCGEGACSLGASGRACAKSKELRRSLGQQR
jgi:hypothetical protein